MFEADPLTIAQFATDAARMALQAGPPADLPGAVPDFVGNILGEVRSVAGEGGASIGETISGMTPGGDAAAGNATEIGAEAAENAPVDVAGR